MTDLSWQADILEPDDDLLEDYWATERALKLRARKHRAMVGWTAAACAACAVILCFTSMLLEFASHDYTFFAAGAVVSTYLLPLAGLSLVTSLGLFLWWKRRGN